jgi:hypothetical protein
MPLLLLLWGAVVVLLFLAEVAIVPPAKPPRWAPRRSERQRDRASTTDHPEPDDKRWPGVAAHGAGLGQSPRPT